MVSFCCVENRSSMPQTSPNSFICLNLSFWQGFPVHHGKLLHFISVGSLGSLFQSCQYVHRVAGSDCIFGTVAQRQGEGRKEAVHQHFMMLRRNFGMTHSGLRGLCGEVRRADRQLQEADGPHIDVRRLSLGLRKLTAKQGSQQRNLNKFPGVYVLDVQADQLPRKGWFWSMSARRNTRI